MQKLRPQRRSRAERPDSFRKIEGIEWARIAAQGPYGAAPARVPRGPRGLGVRYEREVGRAMGDRASAGQWFQYQDLNGFGWCQTDLLVRGIRNALVLEVKLTWLEGAHRQLDCLYRPVVEAALGLPMLGVVVCKNLTSDVPVGSVVGDLKQALAVAKAGGRPVLHWRGGAGATLY